MKKPKFVIGDKVYYEDLDKVGTIVKIINLDDAEDVKAQGYRFYVRFPKWDYSVAQKDLCKI